MALYALLLAQPLVGWAMVSAGGTPVVVFGSLRLPAIAPVDLGLYPVLRQTHSVLAYYWSPLWPRMCPRFDFTPSRWATACPGE
jgi:cytochrome b561